MSKWYYSDYQRNRHGPVSAGDLANLHANGQLAPDTLVWREGLAQWQPWHTLMGEVVADTSRPALASASFMTASSDAPASALANPYTIAEPRSPYAPPQAPLVRNPDLHTGGEVVFAGFWKRVAAYFIDATLLGVVGAVLGAAIGGAIGMGGSLNDGLQTNGVLAIQAVVQLVSLVLAACYAGWFYASAEQATPGKMAIGIKVVRGNGGPVGFWRGFTRYFAQIPSSLILGIGFMMAGFTERKQALHDMMCDTLVVDKWAYTAHPERQRRELGTVAVVILVLCGLLVVGMGVLILAAIGLAVQAGH